MKLFVTMFTHHTGLNGVKSGTKSSKIYVKISNFFSHFPILYTQVQGKSIPVSKNFWLLYGIMIVFVGLFLILFDSIFSATN